MLPSKIINKRKIIEKLPINLTLSPEENDWFLFEFLNDQSSSKKYTITIDSEFKSELKIGFKHQIFIYESEPEKIDIKRIEKYNVEGITNIEYIIPNTNFLNSYALFVQIENLEKRNLNFKILDAQLQI